MLDGAARLDDLFDRTDELGMGAIAMTDHGNVFGAYEFYTKARAQGDQADHRAGGLLHPQHPAPRAQAGAVERRRRRRRVGRRRLHPHDPAGRDHRGPPQPLPAVVALLPRGAVLQAPGRPRAAGGVRRRPHRHHGLPVGRGADLAPDRRLRQGPPVRRRLPGHLRQGELLPRADGPRAVHRGAGPRRPAAAVPGPRHPADRDQRLPLRPPGRRALARAPALRVLGQRDERPQAVQARRRRLLHQVRRRDAPALGAHQRPQGGLRQHPADRRALRRLLHRGQLHAALPGAAGGDRGDLVRQGGAVRASSAATREASRRRRRPGPTARSASSPRWASRATSW